MSVMDQIICTGNLNGDAGGNGQVGVPCPGDFRDYFASLICDQEVAASPPEILRDYLKHLKTHKNCNLDILKSCADLPVYTGDPRPSSCLLLFSILLCPLFSFSSILLSGTFLLPHTSMVLTYWFAFSALILKVGRKVCRPVALCSIRTLSVHVFCEHISYLQIIVACFSLLGIIFDFHRPKWQCCSISVLVCFSLSSSSTFSYFLVILAFFYPSFPRRLH